SRLLEDIGRFDRIGRTYLVVYANVELVVVVNVQAIVNEVPLRSIRQREILQEKGCLRRDPRRRDLIVWKGLPRKWIHDGLQTGEIALTHRYAGHGVIKGLAAADARAFVVHKKEGPV